MDKIRGHVPVDTRTLQDLSKSEAPEPSIGRGLGRGRVTQKQAKSANKLMANMSKFEDLRRELNTTGVSVKGRDISSDMARIEGFIEKGDTKKAYTLISKLNRKYDQVLESGHNALRKEALKMIRDQREMVKICTGSDTQSMKFLDKTLNAAKKDIRKADVGSLKKLIVAIGEENKSHAVKLHRIQPNHHLAINPDSFSCNELTADIKAQFSEQYISSPINVVKAKAEELQALAVDGEEDASGMLEVFHKDNKETLMDMTIGDLKDLLAKLKALLPDAFKEPGAVSGSHDISL